MSIFTGTPDADSLAGSGDADVLLGLDGADTLEGGDGDDSLDGGGGGADLLRGEGGADTVRGGGGDDVIEGGNGDEAGDLLDGGEGRDEFSYFGDRTGVTIDLAAGTTSSGARLTNIEDVWSDIGDDRLRGNTDANRLRGLHGDDTLDGGAGDDVLEGERDDDILVGGAGDDTLDGGVGFDVAAFSGKQGEYIVTMHRDSLGAATHVTVADTVIGRDGTDTIVLDAEGQTVERLLFDYVPDDVSCFMPGTLVATPSGQVPVETLRRGDTVLTAEGRAAPIVWMGRQTVSLRFADPVRVLPVRIQAGALRGGLPRRDLLVSPDHALLLDGVLVQAGALVNGTTIRRETDVPGRWTYWHVELADHALVLVEGVAAETFVDNAGRLAFDNWDEHQALHPEGHSIAEMPLPRAKASRQVPQALRERLAALAKSGQSSVPTAA